jgi:hypothetical protein
MSDADTMTALLWVSVIAGYAWSVWCLGRLCHRADADHAAERRSAVVDMRRYVVTRRTGGVAPDAEAPLGTTATREVFYPGRMTPRNCAQ